MNNFTNATNTPAFTACNCAICGKPVDPLAWYAVILDRPVHSACFQASRQVGHTLKLIPKITLSKSI